MNIIVWLEFELTYFVAVVQHFRHYATETSPRHLFEKSLKYSVSLL